MRGLKIGKEPKGASFPIFLSVVALIADFSPTVVALR
jgi:hypothetical protein